MPVMLLSLSKELEMRREKRREGRKKRGETEKEKKGEKESRVRHSFTFPFLSTILCLLLIPLQKVVQQQKERQMHLKRTNLTDFLSVILLIQRRDNNWWEDDRRGIRPKREEPAGNEGVLEKWNSFRRWVLFSSRVDYFLFCLVYPIRVMLFGLELEHKWHLIIPWFLECIPTSM